jgi:hypothetical protein
VSVRITVIAGVSVQRADREELTGCAESRELQSRRLERSRLVRALSLGHVLQGRQDGI